MKPISILAFTICILFVCRCGFAQTDVPAELKPGLAQITESRVTDVVTFLASDEMAGRDTPSPQLRAAGDFVAGHFEKAGLKGGGDDNSFFQVTRVNTVANPSADVVFETEDGQQKKHLGMFAAGDDELVYQGNIPLADPDGKYKKPFDGPVAIDASDLTGRRASFRLASRMSNLVEQGATGFIVIVKPDSQLASTANQARQPRLVRGRRVVRVPTLLVDRFEPGVYSLRMPRQQHGEAEVRNVIGMIRGSDPDLAKEAIIFSAHLDHVGQQPGLEDPIFNGADDNATGVTAVINLAYAYGAMKQPPKRTVIFMTFWGEEKGLLGSRYYAAHPLWPLEKTVANINIEMVGRPEGGSNEKAWMTGWDQSNLGELMAGGAKQVGVEIFNHPRFSAMLYRASDNYSFVDKGVIAHSFSAGSLHSDYHQPGDQVEKLNLKHMTRVIQGLYAGSLPIANGELTPEKN